VGTCGDPSRAKVSIRWKIGTSSALHRKIEAKTLSADLHPKEVETLSPRIEVVRLFGSIQLHVLGMKEAVEDGSLILLGDPNAKILNL
jgi:hypothetical protein